LTEPIFHVYDRQIKRAVLKGITLAVKCPKCNSENPDAATFCAECGTKLDLINAGPTKTMETPKKELTTGSAFAARYQIIEELGKGGMGRVYRALDKKLNEEVALKLIKPEIASDKNALERFSSELKIARKISHRNIGRVYEIMEAEGTHYITMEYVPGEDLKSFILRSGRIDIPKALLIGKQVCEGLAEAHRQGVVHRDLKPSNIMIDKQGNARIMDFGIARLLKAKGITDAGVMISTTEYMSPEQVEGKKIDQRSDIYSLGIILYEMVTGQPPFEGDTPFSVGMKQKSEPPPAPKQINAQIPDDLNDLILKCLEKEKEDRFKNAGEIRSELERVQKGLPTTEKAIPRKKSGTSREITVQFRLGVVPRWVLIFASLVIIGLLLWLFLPKHKLQEPSPKIENSIAVISFENQTGDQNYDYLQKAIPNLLITNLERTGKLYVATWERMHDLLKQIGKKDVANIDKDLGFEICRREGIESIVTGSFVKAGDTFATDVKVLDVESKKLLKGANVRGRGEDSILETQIDELTYEIARGLGLARNKMETQQQRIAEVTTTSMKAYNYLLEGKEYINKMLWEEARKSLEEAISIDPEFAAAYDWLGIAYSYLGDREARIEAIKKAMEFSDKATEKERLYIQISYESAIKGNQEKVFRLYKELVQKFPKDKDAHYDLGWTYFARGMHEEAISEFHKTLELDPNMGSTLNALAYTYLDMGENEKAEEYFQKYMDMYPGDANPIDSLAEHYFVTGQLDKAIEKYKQVLKIQPDFGADFRIAYIYALKENYEEAMKWVDQFIDRAPSADIKTEGFLFRAVYNSMQGKKEQAFRDLEKGKEYADEVQNVMAKAYMDFTRACIYYDLRDFEKSREYIRKAYDTIFSSVPGDNIWNKSWHNFYIGLIDAREGHLESAKSRLKAMMSFEFPPNPFMERATDSLSNWLQAEIGIAEEFPNKAIQILKTPELTFPGFQAYIAMYYNLPMIRDGMARAYLKKGDIDKAIAVYEERITFNPEKKSRRLIHPKYHYLLSKLYEENGQKSMAVKQYEVFLKFWKDADPDLPELIDAQKRLDQLKTQ